MKSYLFYFFLFISAVAFPQSQISSVRYSTDNGLSHNIVQGILQDKNGFVWIAGWNGLERYDSNSFRNFKTYPEDSVKLSNVRIEKIQLSSSNNIWCRTYDKNLYLFDTRTFQFENVFVRNPSLGNVGQVKRVFTLNNGVSWIESTKGALYRVDENLRGAESVMYYGNLGEAALGQQLYSIRSDSQNREWIFTERTLCQYGKTKPVRNLPFHYFLEISNDSSLFAADNGYLALRIDPENFQRLDFPFKSDSVTSLTRLPIHNSVAIATSRRLIIWNCVSNLFSEISLPGHSQSLHLHNLKETTSGELWMFDNNKRILRCDLSTFKATEMPYPVRMDTRRKNASFINEDSSGTLWMNMKNCELCYFNERSQKLEQACVYENGEPSPFCFSCDNYMKDNQGNIWGGSSNGIEKLIFSPKKYEYLTQNRKNEVRTTFIDSDGYIWLGTKDATIEIYTRENQYIGNLRADGTIVKDNKAGFGCNIYSIFQDSKGRIWLGSRNEGLYRLCGKNRCYKIEHFIYDSKNEYSLNCNSVYDIKEDSQGRIWLATFGGGICMIDKPSDRSLSFISVRNLMKNYPINTCPRVRCIELTSSGVVMAGTTNGLITFSADFQKVQNISFYYNACNMNTSSSLSSNDVLDITEASDRRIYLSTLSSGMSVVSIDSLLSCDMAFSYLNSRNGLCSDLVISSVEDGVGNLWIQSLNNISSLNLKTGIVDNYTTSELNLKLEMTDAGTCIDSAGNILVATTTGALFILPDQLKGKTYGSPIQIIRADIYDGENLRVVDSSLDRCVVLSPTEKFITVSFTAIDYTSLKNRRYSYRLCGLDDQWLMINSATSASFMDLNPGNYTFEVRSTDSEGKWSDHTARMQILVEPEFAQTVWAKLIMVAILLMIFSAAIYLLLYVSGLRHKVGLERELTAFKLKFFTDISHELRTPVTLISGPIDEVLESEHLSLQGQQNMKVAKRNAQRMLQLINQILDFRKIQSTKMKLCVEPADVQTLSKQAFDSFEALAAHNSINYEYESDNLPALIYTDKDKLQKILTNLLSNAFKHTPLGGSIALSVKIKDDKICFSVSDNGQGISQEKLKRVFERFESFADSDPSISTGIGLSLVREFVNLLHGHLGVESAEGKGSRFYFQIPYHYADFENDERAEFILSDNIPLPVVLEEDNSNEAERTTILVVEDNEELRSFIVGILSKDYTVIQAPNGRDALQITIEKMPDIVISDVMMPEMDGIEYLQKVRSDNRISHTLVMILSARSSIDDRIQGLEFGADEYMTKPFSSALLKTRIATLLKRRRDIQSYYSSFSNKTQKTVTVPSGSDLFISRVVECIKSNMQNPDFTVDALADNMNMSRTVFYRKLRALAGISPVDYIKELRLKHALELLDSREFSISEIAYQCGFATPQYFSKVFREKNDCTPTEYRQRLS